MFAGRTARPPHHVVDVNRTQADGDLVLEVEPLAEKWRAFGWWAHEFDGNDIEALCGLRPRSRGRRPPKAIVSHHARPGVPTSAKERTISSASATTNGSGRDELEDPDERPARAHVDAAEKSGPFGQAILAIGERRTESSRCRPMSRG